MSKDVGWEEATLPSVLLGGLGSFGVAWHLVRSERSQAHRPIAQVGVGVVVASSMTAMLLTRLGPPTLVYVVLVAGLAMSLGYVISAVVELCKGTYAETEHPAPSKVNASRHDPAADQCFHPRSR